MQKRINIAISKNEKIVKLQKELDDMTTQCEGICAATNSVKKISKKDLYAARNRITAQISRDRKNLEMDTLK